MGWLRSNGSLKLYVSLENIGLFCRALLQKRPIILRSLLMVAYLIAHYHIEHCTYVAHVTHVCAHNAHTSFMYNTLLMYVYILHIHSACMCTYCTYIVYVHHIAHVCAHIAHTSLMYVHILHIHRLCTPHRVCMCTYCKYTCAYIAHTLLMYVHTPHRSCMCTYCT